LKSRFIIDFNIKVNDDSFNTSRRAKERDRHGKGALMKRSGLIVSLVLGVVVILGQTGLGGEGEIQGRMAGRVIDESGQGLGGVLITLEEYGNGRAISEVITNERGDWELNRVKAGRYLVRARGEGFARLSREIVLKTGEELGLELTLSLEKITEEMMITATTISGFTEGIPRIPGSVQVIDLPMLEQSRVLTVNEALRKVPGVHTRDEEGLGLRPNIGMRGVNPTRSTKVLLLEDGIPLAYAPYGDNASYYHPPIERFESIEVLKGSGQLAYGPSTIGGVINYLTPNAPAKTTGAVTLMGGNRRFFNGGASFGGTWKQTGLITHYLRKQSDGARENTHADIHDLQTKIHQTLTGRQALTVKTSYYGETSNLTYSGLTEDEYRRNPRWNPFRNDYFYVDRWGASVSHAFVKSSNMLITTNLYAMRFDRDWWRQSSNSLQRPNDAADPACGGMVNLLTTCGNEGRVRSYDNWGVESRLRSNFRLLGLSHEFDFGGRFHNEDQKRLQFNGNGPKSRSGLVVENNLRHNRAVSSFIQDRFRIGRLLITPGLRIERITFERVNRLGRLGSNGQGVTGRVDRTQIIPGLGISFDVGRGTFVYAGLHRGFAPPRTEDIINNMTGGAVDLDPELSWNYEAGLRHQIGQLWRIEASVFRMDYSNQVIPASLAGGIGATLTNGGSTRQEGLEISSRFDSGGKLGRFGDLFTNVALTWLPVAEFRGPRFSSISGFGNVLVTGNRLPYAPRSLINASVGYRSRGLTAMIEAVQTGAQDGDDLNLAVGSASGLLGRIPGNTIWNTTINYEVESLRSTFFFTVKNLFDRVFMVDRTRGLIPGIPRMLQVGVKIEIK
jgi:Fe(3+) dicitrate transport protein